MVAAHEALKEASQWREHCWQTFSFGEANSSGQLKKGFIDFKHWPPPSERVREPKVTTTKWPVREEATCPSNTKAMAPNWVVKGADKSGVIPPSVSFIQE